MSNVPLRKPRKEDDYDWMVMPDAYFAVALLCCDKLLQSQFTLDVGARKIFSNHIFEGLDFRSPHRNHELIRPLVFNFKQGIELYVKGLFGFFTEEYAHCHDLREIFERGIQLAKKSSTKKYLFFVDLHKKTWSIIEKYYYGTYISTHSDFAHPDKMNISERYPRNGDGYDMGALYEWVTIEKVEEIKKDIQTLERIFAEAKRKVF